MLRYEQKTKETHKRVCSFQRYYNIKQYKWCQCAIIHEFIIIITVAHRIITYTIAFAFRLYYVTANQKHREDKIKNKNGKWLTLFRCWFQENFPITFLILNDVRCTK